MAMDLSSWLPIESRKKRSKRKKNRGGNARAALREFCGGPFWRHREAGRDGLGAMELPKDSWRFEVNEIQGAQFTAYT